MTSETYLALAIIILVCWLFILGSRIQRLEEKAKEPTVTQLPHPLANVDLAGIDSDQRREIIKQVIEQGSIPHVIMSLPKE